MAGDHPSHSNLRLRVLDGRALPVQEAVFGVNHLLGLAGLLKSGFQLHRHILAHCGKESTGGLGGFRCSDGQRDAARGDGTAAETSTRSPAASRKQAPRPFKEITGNGSTDSTGNPLKQEHLNQRFGVSTSTQPAAVAQLGWQTAPVLPAGFPTALFHSHRSLCLRAISRSLPPGRGWGLFTMRAPAWATAPPRDTG